MKQKAYGVQVFSPTWDLALDDSCRAKRVNTLVVY